MRYIALAAAVLFAGCAGLPAAKDAADRKGEAVRFTEEHQKTRDAAFRAAAGWLSEHYTGGANVLLGTDAGAGTLAAKGIRRWSKPIDSLGLHFHEGTVEYTLTATVTDRTVMMEFLTGDVSGDTEVGPKELMPQLVPFYQNLRDGIMKAIAGN